MDLTSVFIHIPRTGGVALKWALNDKIQNLEYINAQSHAPASERNLEGVYSFTIIRNPWDRAVSLYHHHKTALSFAEWFTKTDLDQASFFMQDDIILVNDVFRFESLVQQLPELCERAGWPQLTLNHVNASLREPYQVYYTGRVRDMANEAFGDFAIRHNYRFD